MRHKELDVWKVSMTLAEKIYQLTRSFPKYEQFGLVAQMRRSAVSIPSNIAEGHGRFSNKSYHRFLTISYGSLLELDTQLQLANKLHYIDSEQYIEINKLIVRITQMLYKFMKKMAAQ